MKNIAIIPARSGSKGLPNKNIRLLNGVPLMAYTIKAALDSGVFARVMVSTDSEEYACVAKEWGAEVPFLRSAKTATDTSSSWSVVREVLDKYKEKGEIFDTVALLQVTSPLRNGEHISEAYRLMEQKNANAIISICKTPMPIEKCRHLSEDLCMNSFCEKEGEYRRRQNFKPAYHDNGAIYLCQTDAFLRQVSIFDNACYGYEMDRLHSTDVDELEDFTIAEALIRYLPEYQNYFEIANS